VTTPTIATITAALKAAIETKDGWQLSTEPFDSFFDATVDRTAKSFVLSAPRTQITDPRRRVRTRPSSEPGHRVRTELRARFAHRIRLDGAWDDLQTAYTDELELLQAAASIAVVNVGNLVLDDITRRQQSREWHFFEAVWFVDHLYATIDANQVYTPPGGGQGGVTVILGPGVVNDDGTANVDFATNSGAHVTGGKVAADLKNGSVQVNAGNEVEAVFLDGCVDTGAGIGPDLANGSVQVDGAGEVAAVVLDGATDTGTGVGPNLANGSVEVSGGAVRAIVLDGATDTGGGVGPDLRAGDPLEVVGGEVQVDQVAVLGDGGVVWNDSTRKVDATATPFGLQDVTAADVLVTLRGNLASVPTVTDQPGRLRITWTQAGRTDGDGETAVVVLQPRDKDGNPVDDLHLRQMAVQLRARWSAVGAGAVEGVSGDPICRVGVVAVNRTSDWLATDIDHSATVGIVGSSTAAGLARTASSGAAAGDGTKTLADMNGIDATFAPFDPVHGDLGFGTLSYTVTDGVQSLEANAQVASGNVSDTDYRWALAIMIGNSLAVSGGTNTIDVDLDAVCFQSHA
jgi:hypothetical protein